MLVGEQTASELLVAAAPDGSYRTESAGLVTVRGGARAVTAPAAVVRVGPVYDLAEDFAP